MKGGSFLGKNAHGGGKCRQVGDGIIGGRITKYINEVVQYKNSMSIKRVGDQVNSGINMKVPVN